MVVLSIYTVISTWSCSKHGSCEKACCECSPLSQADDKETKLSQVEAWGRGPACHMRYVAKPSSPGTKNRIGKATERGQGRGSDSIFRCLWLYSFHPTSTSIIRGSLYSNLTAVDAYGQNSQQSGWVWLQTKIVKKPWASILGESYSNLFRLKSYVSFSSIFIIVALSHWSAPVWNYSPQWVPTRLPHIFVLNSQGRRPLCEI